MFIPYGVYPVAHNYFILPDITAIRGQGTGSDVKTRFVARARKYVPESQGLVASPGDDALAVWRHREIQYSVEILEKTTECVDDKYRWCYITKAHSHGTLLNKTQKYTHILEIRMKNHHNAPQGVPGQGGDLLHGGIFPHYNLV